MTSHGCHCCRSSSQAHVWDRSNATPIPVGSSYNAPGTLVGKWSTGMSHTPAPPPPTRSGHTPHTRCTPNILSIRESDNLPHIQVGDHRLSCGAHLPPTTQDHQMIEGLTKSMFGYCRHFYLFHVSTRTLVSWVGTYTRGFYGKQYTATMCLCNKTCLYVLNL